MSPKLVSVLVVSAILSRGDGRVRRVRLDGQRTDLRGANLTRADLTGAHLGEADLAGAHLGMAILFGANLTRADLTGANVSGADLRGADLGSAIGLVQAQIDSGATNLQTVLPPGLHR